MKLSRSKLPLIALLLTVLPRGAKQGMAVMLLLFLAPPLLLALLIAVSALFEHVPEMWTLLAAFLLYRIWRWLR